MHLANASGPDPPAPVAVLDPVVVPGPPVLAALDAGVFVLPTVAAVGPGELSPHPPPGPHSRVLRRAGAFAVSRQAAWMDPVLHRLLLVSFGCAHRFYEMDGFGKVSLALETGSSKRWVGQITESRRGRASCSAVSSTTSAACAPRAARRSAARASACRGRSRPPTPAASGNSSAGGESPPAGAGGRPWRWPGVVPSVGRPSGGAPHAAKACLYAGACRSTVAGNRRIAPSKSLISWYSRADVGRPRGSGVGELGDAVLAHAHGDLAQLRQRLRGGRGPPAGDPPPGRSFWHFACAAWNAGDEGLIAAGMRKPPPGLGSGKLGTPLERMHLANASPGPPAPEAAEPELAAPALVVLLDPAAVAEAALGALDAEVLAPPAAAAGGLEELPPHPATSTPVTSVARASRRARRERVSRFGWMLSCIWSPSAVLRVCASGLRDGRFGTVSLLKPERPTGPAGRPPKPWLANPPRDAARAVSGGQAGKLAAAPRRLPSVRGADAVCFRRLVIRRPRLRRDIAARDARIAPSSSAMNPYSGGPSLGGTEVLGSGNQEMPRPRMHCETFSVRARVCLEGWVAWPGGGTPGRGWSCWHFTCAALNGGDKGSVPPGPGWSWKFPLAVGSGKVGTPLARIHAANSSAAKGPTPVAGARSHPIMLVDGHRIL